jgi:conjugative transfer signal peptidase TraF
LTPAGNKKILLGFSAAVVLIFGFSTYFFTNGYRLNMTASYPIGIYQVDENKTIARGEMILFCPPPQGLFLVGAKRGYIAAGICPGNISPLQKRIVAITGDKITTTHAGVFINGELQKNSVIYRNDYQGNPLPMYKGGVLQEGEIFVMSDYNDRSFDSRYYGAVPSKNIIGHTKPIFLF